MITLEFKISIWQKTHNKIQMGVNIAIHINKHWGGRTLNWQRILQNGRKKTQLGKSKLPNEHMK